MLVYKCQTAVMLSTLISRNLGALALEKTPSAKAKH
jgi:hypothetical protein